MQNGRNHVKKMFFVLMLLITLTAVTACGSDGANESESTVESQSLNEGESTIESGNSDGTTDEKRTDYSGGAGGTIEESSPGTP